MTIVIDSHIPFLIEAVRREWPEVDICPMEPEQITSETVREADVLVVRTRTAVNASLLEHSHVRLVCTATIGYDHIDTDYCDRNDIRWMSCPGCNAQAVCDYIEQVLTEWWKVYGRTPGPAPFFSGVVGVGHVGTLVAQMAERKGCRVLLNDPPKGIGVPLDELARQCDIITFHVPLTREGQYPTYHLCDEAFLAKCKPGALIINAARGGVVDEQALLRSGHPYVLDTWENEPHIDPHVLQHAFRASMHIAGYSVQGKRNATQMCLDEIARMFGLKRIDISGYPYPASSQQNSNEPDWLAAVTDQLKAAPTAFEALRKAYPLRGV